MTTDRDRILSEFIDSWNAGRRPKIDDFVDRAPEEEREGLLEDITGFISWAPTPDYGASTLAEIRSEPAVAAALSTYVQRSMSWPQVLAARRQELSLSLDEIASRVVDRLKLSRKREAKVGAYLERVERGELDSSRFDQRLLDALSSILETQKAKLGGVPGDWTRPAAAAAYRAEPDAIEETREHFELMADMASTPSADDWDEVDDLFLGGR